MTNLSKLFAIKNGGSLSADDTKTIDSALAQTGSSDIPDAQVENIVTYLDSNLLNNGACISVDEFAALEKLRSDLQARR